MILITKDSTRIRYHCPTGQHIEMRHRAIMQKDGRRELIPDRKKHTYDIIQSHLEECLIENIIKRALEGDTSVLEMMKGTYTDITGAPKSLAEAQQMIIDLKQKFDELPKDIKQKFDYNVEQYIAEFGSDAWAEKTGVAAVLAAEESARKHNEELNKNIENFFTPKNTPEKGEVTNES